MSAAERPETHDAPDGPGRRLQEGNSSSATPIGITSLPAASSQILQIEATDA